MPQILTLGIVVGLFTVVSSQPQMLGVIMGFSIFVGLGATFIRMLQG